QHAIFVLGLNGFRVHGVCQSETAAERSEGTFHAQIIALVHCLLELALPANRQDVVLDANVELLRLDVRKIGLDDEFVLRLVDVYRWRPRSQVAFFRRVRKGLSEKAIDLMLQRSFSAKRIETADSSSHCHLLQRMIIA